MITKTKQIVVLFFITDTLKGKLPCSFQSMGVPKIVSSSLNALYPWWSICPHNMSRGWRSVTIQVFYCGHQAVIKRGVASLHEWAVPHVLVSYFVHIRCTTAQRDTFSLRPEGFQICARNWQYKDCLVNFIKVLMVYAYHIPKIY